LQHHSQAYNTLYLILNGSLALFQPKDEPELERELFWVNEEQKSYAVHVERSRQTKEAQ
jgi:hypothetical protein